MPWIIGAVLHATVIAIIAFFILFAAGKAEGFTALLGRLLGYWVLLIAIVALAGGISASMNGGKPFGMDMMHGHHGWHHMGPPPDGPMMPPPPAAPASPVKH